LASYPANIPVKIRGRNLYAIARGIHTNQARPRAAQKETCVDRAEERQWIRRAQAGSQDAFAHLYRAHVQAIYRYIAVRVSDPLLAEDLTGDVFIRALKSMAHYQDAGHPFLAWLYRIAHARVVDHYRRQGRRPVESDVEDQPIAVEHDMDSPMLRQQVGDVLREAMQSLTEEQQQVLTLRFIEGLKLEDAALVMGKNSNAIKQLQHRALRALAGRLQRAGVDIESFLAGLS
jgi:RNA polymerase sigma-70 factor (ECF subfamily)